MKTAHVLTRAARGTHGRGLLALPVGIAAALAKRTAGRKVEQRRRHARDLSQALAALVVRRHGVEQALRVWMRGPPEHFLARALLDAVATIRSK